MLHTKSFIRRLVSVPWLLTAGLVLGWTGVEEAMAQDKQDITLTIDVFEVSEAKGKDGGKQEITVKAAVAADAANDIRIGLGFVSEVVAAAQPSATNFSVATPHNFTTVNSRAGLGTRFRLEGMTDPIVIKEGTKSGTAVISLYPHDDGAYTPATAVDSQSDPPTQAELAATEPYVYIGFRATYLQGTTETSATVTYGAEGEQVSGAGNIAGTVLRLYEDDIAANASQLIFSPDMVKVSNESDEITITVNAYLNGKNPFGGDYEFVFGDVSAYDATGFGLFLNGMMGDGFTGVGTPPVATPPPVGTKAKELADRDVDYSETDGFGAVTLEEDGRSVSIKVTLDPNSFDIADRYPRYILLGNADPVTYDPDPDTADDDITLAIRPAIIQIADTPKHKVKSVTEVSSPIYEDGGGRSYSR